MLTVIYFTCCNAGTRELIPSALQNSLMTFSFSFFSHFVNKQQINSQQQEIIQPILGNPLINFPHNLTNGEFAYLSKISFGMSPFVKD
jgi:hypothetical protein